MMMPRVKLITLLFLRRELNIILFLHFNTFHNSAWTCQTLPTLAYIVLCKSDAGLWKGRILKPRLKVSPLGNQFRCRRFLT